MGRGWLGQQSGPIQACSRAAPRGEAADPFDFISAGRERVYRVPRALRAAAARSIPPGMALRCAALCRAQKAEHPGPRLGSPGASGSNRGSAAAAGCGCASIRHGANPRTATLGCRGPASQGVERGVSQRGVSGGSRRGFRLPPSPAGGTRPARASQGPLSHHGLAAGLKAGLIRRLAATPFRERGPRAPPAYLSISVVR